LEGQAFIALAPLLIVVASWDVRSSRHEGLDLIQGLRWLTRVLPQ
jgi:hypothetical protein